VHNKKIYDRRKRKKLFLFFLKPMSMGHRSIYKDFERAEFASGRKYHFFSKAVQLRITANGVGELSATGAGKRNRLLSAVSSQEEKAEIADSIERSGGAWKRGLGGPAWNTVSAVTSTAITLPSAPR
jgi:hypothetical protein